MNFPSVKKLSLAATFAAGMAGPAHAGLITLDFEDLTAGNPVDNPIQGSIEYNDGMTITNLHNDRFLAAYENGNTSLSSTAFGQSYFRFAVDDGSLFNFEGMDVFNPDRFNIDSFLLVGYLNEDNTLGQTVYNFDTAALSFDPVDALETPVKELYVFSNTSFRIDNVKYDIRNDDNTGGGDVVVDVPEPSSLAILTLGLAGLGLGRKFAAPKTPTA